MKKILVLCLAFALLLCLVACGGNEEEVTDTPTDSVTVTDTNPSESNPDESEKSDAEETFSPDLNLTEIDRFD